MKWFWLRLLRFSYRRLKEQPKMPVGVPGNRDPDNPCPGYAPIRLPGDEEGGHCEGDGHYLCEECCFLAWSDPEDHDDNLFGY